MKSTGLSPRRRPRRHHRDAPRQVAPVPGWCWPFLLALGLAPLLFGSVKLESQAAVGLGLGWALLLLAWAPAESAPPLISPRRTALIWILLFVPLAPLPGSLVRWIDPARSTWAALAGAPAPSWMALSLSPANSLQRLWQLALLAACFYLGRHAAFNPGPRRALALAVAASLLALCGCEIYSRLSGDRRVLGLWAARTVRPAGAFGNRNDFANWIALATLFLGGWCLRNFKPIQSARLSPLTRDKRFAADLFIAPILVLSLTLAVLSGSRGGCLSFMTGVAAWLFFLRRRSRSRTRWLLLIAGGLAVLLLILPASGFLLERVSQASSPSAPSNLKWALWKSAVAAFKRFPLFGGGLGTFLQTSNLYKIDNGQWAFTHAENDCLEWLAETGVLGLAVAGLTLMPLLRQFKTAFFQRLEEPELFFGALAAAIAFAFHSLFDFPFQIPANACLAAALLGVAAGLGQSGARASVLPLQLPSGAAGRRALAALILLGVAGVQGASFIQFQSALRQRRPADNAAQMESSIRLWPWPSRRQVALLRADGRLLLNSPDGSQPEIVRHAETFLRKQLFWDPLNWEVHLENAWFCFAFAPALNQGLADATAAQRLNPHAADIPLQFARRFAADDPERAQQFLREAEVDSAADFERLFEIAWSIRPDPALLWNLTPNRPPAIEALARFAIAQRLFPMAARALSFLENRMAPADLAALALQARQPDVCLKTLAPLPSAPNFDLLRAQAYLQLRQFAQAIGAAEKCWQTLAPSPAQIDPRFFSKTAYSDLERRWRARPKDRAAARSLAEACAQQPPEQRDLRTIQALADAFPGEPRILWILFDTCRGIGRADRAAQAALRLAEQAQ